MINITYIFFIAASLLLVSCGKKSPDPDSNDVKESMESAIYKLVQSGFSCSDEQARDRFEFSFVDIYSTNVDSEARCVEYNFTLEVTDVKSGGILTKYTGGKSIAAYGTEGKLHVDIQEPDALIDALKGALQIAYKINELKRDKIYTETLTKAKELYDAGTIRDGYKISEDALMVLLDRSSSSGVADRQRPLQRATLAFAEGDGFDADKVIVKYLTEEVMMSSIRADLFKYVMPHRQNFDNIKPLLDFVLKTDNSHAATQAIMAAKASCKDASAQVYLDDFLSLIKNTEEESIRGAAESAASEIIRNSSNPESYGATIINSYKSSNEEAPKCALLRLLATAGGDKAAKSVKQALKSDDSSLQNAAISALGNWVDDEQFSTLTDFISETESTILRKQAFNAAYGFLSNGRERDSDDLGDMWDSLSKIAKSTREKLQVILGLAKQDSNWAVIILDRLIQDKEEIIVDKAEQAKEFVERNIKNK